MGAQSWAEKIVRKCESAKVRKCESAGVRECESARVRECGLLRSVRGMGGVLPHARCAGGPLPRRAFRSFLATAGDPPQLRGRGWLRMAHGASDGVVRGPGGGAPNAKVRERELSHSRTFALPSSHCR